MNIQDAINILGLDTEITEKTIKHAYRKACSKYHPDKGGSNEMMQAVNSAYETLKNHDGELKNCVSSNDYADELNDAILAVINLPNITLEVCGSWVWVSGDTKTHKEIFKTHQFKWAPKKKMWHFRPQDWKSSSRGNMDMEKIRTKYGSQSVKASKYKQNRIQRAA